MSYHKPNKPNDINEWRKQHEERGDEIEFNKLDFSGDKTLMCVFAKFKTNFLCPWCRSRVQHLERYNFVFNEIEFQFMGCSRYPMCGWTSNDDPPIMKS